MFYDMDNKVHIVRLLLGFSFLSISKLSFPQYDEVKFEHTRVEDGMPLNNVTCILQDHLGFLWLCTKSGLVEYDGYAMTIYRPESGVKGYLLPKRRFTSDRLTRKN